MRFSGYRRKYAYPFAALLLALGAPGGLLALRASVHEQLTNVEWLVDEVSTNALTYGYIAIGTAIIFIGLGIVLGGHEDQLRRVSLSDSLTGLPNRRHLEMRLREELARAERYKQPLTLMFLDLDGLKSINDRLGHEAGDKAINAVARTLRHTCRNTDLAARFGGDEFAVLAPNITEDAALALAERIRGALKSEVGWRALGHHPLTLSIGLADTRCVVELSPDALFTAADRALYEAKQGGKDRVALAPVESTELVRQRGASGTQPEKEKEKEKSDRSPEAGIRAVSG
jgi:diguanylate cyclase (GGDEF)-like protein